MNIKSTNNVYNQKINFVGKQTKIKPQTTLATPLPKKPSVPITISNFHYIDHNVWRGAKPTEAELSQLKANGVTRVISFCTNYNPQTRKVGKVPDEANWAKNLGIKFYWMPFKSNENPPLEYIDNFFKILDEAKNKNECVYIHCRHGKDRTGLFSAMYKIRNKKCSLSDAIREMMKYGHDANNNPNLIPFLVDFKESLSFRFSRFSFKSVLNNFIGDSIKAFRKVKF